MKEVDQHTGTDLNPPLPTNSSSAEQNDSFLLNPDAPWLNPSEQPKPKIAQNVKRPRIRLSTPERWELRQMQGGGAISQMDLPDFDQELGVMKNYNGNKIALIIILKKHYAFPEESDGEDIEIELVEDDPAFLKGYGKHVIDLEPVKVVKNPDGSLAQAALMQVELEIWQHDH